MGTKYRKDDDLAFLQYCSEEDIRQLAEFIIFNNDGQERLCSEIFVEKEFKQHKDKPDQWRKCWHLVAGELQHFGGDTFANLIRRKGVLYKEILVDVCKKINVSFDKKSSAYEIENKLIERLVEMAWDKMSESERHETLRGLNLDDLARSRADWAFISSSILANGLVAGPWYAWAASAARTSFSSAVISKSALAAAPVVLSTRLVASVAVPLAVASLAPAISGTAYRVTVPAVIQIAYMRRKYEEKERF